MIDLIYSLIYNLIAQESELPGITDICNLLTCITLVIAYCLIVKLVVWAFGIPFRAWSGRDKWKY